MSTLHLLRPAWLLALIPMALLLWLKIRQRPGPGDWRSACDPALLHFLLVGEPERRRYRPILALGVGGLLAILALAGPAWKQLEQPLFRQQSSLVILLDLSRSMDSADVQPSRLARARYKLLDILERRREGDTALIVYAAQPFVVTPLTEDADTVAALARTLSSEIVPVQGSRPDLALAQGFELLSQAGAVKGDLLFITDHIEQRLVQGVLAQRPPGYTVNVLGIGSAAGAPIPLPQGGFLEDSTGEIVVSALDSVMLGSVADQGGGRYSDLTADDRDLDRLFPTNTGIPSGDAKEVPGLGSDRWREEGPWLILLLLPLAALAFRRGYLALVPVLFLPISEPVSALDWGQLWQRPDQQAAELMESGDLAGAAVIFDDPLWRSAAQYRAGDYAQSLESLQGIDSPLADYNRGNALARLGRLQEALAAYDRALERTPDDQDARFNRDLVKDLLQQQQSPEQQPEQQGESGGESRQEEQNTPGTGDAAGSGAPEAQRKQDESDLDPAESQDQDMSGNDIPQQAQAAGQPPDPGAADQPPEQTAEPETVDKPHSNTPDREPGETADLARQKAPAETVTDQSLEEADDESTQQWLRRIPDDPGGLLRRKFQYQYRQKYQGRSEQNPW